MVERAEKLKQLKKGGTIVEPTSGNTGTGLAMVAALRGYHTVFVMPDKMSNEKRNVLRAFGAKVVITPTATLAEDERSYYKVSDRLAKEIPGGYKPDQYHNPANPLAHYRTTGPEIWEQTEGKITHFICGMGTGGTITGVGKYLKEKNPRIKVIGIDPVGSVFKEYSRSRKFPKIMKTYKVEGVGEDFIPSTIDFQYIDEVIQVDDKQCFLTARALARSEGILVGGSGGMALYGAQQVVKKMKKGLAVVLFPDSGKSYLSKMYNDDWMRENGFLDETPQHTVHDVLVKLKKQRAAHAVLSVSPSDTVAKAVQLMKKHDVSQLPVIDHGKLLGRVSERHLLQGLYDRFIGPSNTIASITNPDVKTVTQSESVEYVAHLLEQTHMVVVLDDAHKPIHVLTRIDVIGFFAS
jgi:cystathionine beta-synthase